MAEGVEIEMDLEVYSMVSSEVDAEEALEEGCLLKRRADSKTFWPNLYLCFCICSCRLLLYRFRFAI